MAMHCKEVYFLCLNKNKKNTAGYFPAFKHLCMIHRQGNKQHPSPTPRGKEGVGRCEEKD